MALQDNFKGATGVRANKGGRPKGVKNSATLEREKVQEAFNQRVFKIANSLLNAQASVAKGMQVLYRVDEFINGNGKVSKKAPVVVTDPKEIAQYIDSEFGTGEGLKGNGSYYYITVKEPSSMAVDSLLNRAMGKPKETMEVQGAMQLKVDF